MVTELSKLLVTLAEGDFLPPTNFEKYCSTRIFSALGALLSYILVESEGLRVVGDKYLPVCRKTNLDQKINLGLN